MQDTSNSSYSWGLTKSTFSQHRSNYLEATHHHCTLLHQHLLSHRSSKITLLTPRSSSKHKHRPIAKQWPWALSTSQHSHERITTTPGPLPPKLASPNQWRHTTASLDPVSKRCLQEGCNAEDAADARPQVDWVEDEWHHWPPQLSISL
jgi:hypothetical protein